LLQVRVHADKALLAAIAQAVTHRPAVSLISRTISGSDAPRRFSANTNQARTSTQPGRPQTNTRPNSAIRPNRSSAQVISSNQRITNAPPPRLNIKVLISATANSRAVLGTVMAMTTMAVSSAATSPSRPSLYKAMPPAAVEPGAVMVEVLMGNISWAY